MSATSALITREQLKPCRLTKTKWIPLGAIVMALLGASLSSQAQTGPFSPTNWPPTIDANAVVDYLSVDPNAAFNTPPAWQPNVSFSGGGDQAFSLSTRAGLSGDESTAAFMNIADANYAQFANTPVVDILLQVYGNDTLYNANGT